MISLGLIQRKRSWGGNVLDLPRASVKLRSELICHGITRSNWTLCYSWDAIHLIHSSLKEAMSVHGRSFVVELVNDFHADHISVVCFNEWSWELSVDADSCLGLDTISSDIELSYCEVIGHGSSCQRAWLIRVGIGRCDAAPRSLATTTVVFWQSLHLSGTIFRGAILLVLTRQDDIEGRDCCVASADWGVRSGSRGGEIDTEPFLRAWTPVTLPAFDNATLGGSKTPLIEN